MQSCQNAISVWKFGNVDGDDEQRKDPSAVTRLALLELPHTNVWFLKIALDPQFEVGWTRKAHSIVET